MCTMFSYSPMVTRPLLIRHPTDNLGTNPQLISKETIEDVIAAFPRKAWSNCFADTMREEVSLKPWSHSTANESFIESVEANTLMQPYE